MNEINYDFIRYTEGPGHRPLTPFCVIMYSRDYCTPGRQRAHARLNVKDDAPNSKIQLRSGINRPRHTLVRFHMELSLAT